MANSKSRVMIVGDFNYPEIDWTEGITPKDSKHEASHFIETVRDSFLVQYVHEPTHYRGNQTPKVLDSIHRRAGNDKQD